jgi:hypothetical protein
LVLVSAAAVVGFGLCSVLERAREPAPCLRLDSCISYISTVTVCWEEAQVPSWDGWLAQGELAFSLVSLRPATIIHYY